MHGMFRSNGACGFVKKPDLLMNRGPHDEVFNPKAKYPVKKTLKVNSGYATKIEMFPVPSIYMISK